MYIVKGVEKIMDLKICGLIDIILIVGTIIFLILGFKKGAIKKIISLAGILVILVFSIIYCGQFAQFLIHHNVIYPSIYGKINTNILTNLENKGLSAGATVGEVLKTGLNIPGFIADMIGKGVTNHYPQLTDVNSVADAVSGYLATMAMNVISFFILAIGLFVVILILKLIADMLRTNKFVKAVDGILGAVLYVTIYAAVVCFIFCILSYFMRCSWFEGAKKWLEVDMQLNTNKFRISKALYEGNILRRLLELFF